MNDMDYFLMVENWSLQWFVSLVAIGMMYSFFWKVKPWKKGLFFLALGMMYIVFGSPVSSLSELGLHSVTMFQHMLVLMVIPILFLKSLPPDFFARNWPGWINAIARSPYIIPLLWTAGAIAMWSGHFLTAGILSSKMGVAICGVAVSSESWISAIPVGMILFLELFAGLLFALPVFHPDSSKRLAPLQSVVYLFTACVSCAILGLYIAFTAGSAAVIEAVPLFTIFQNPFPINLRTDQEIAGLLMWVPGCIIYVTLSMNILLNWYEGGSTEDQPSGDTVKLDTGGEESILVFMDTKPLES